MGKRNVYFVSLGRPYWKTIFGVLELRVSWEDKGTMDIRQQNVRMDIRPTEFISGCSGSFCSDGKKRMGSHNVKLNNF
jgi:hypothetical protein